MKKSLSGTKIEVSHNFIKNISTVDPCHFQEQQ